VTITLRPEHEQLIAEAIEAGLIHAAGEVLDVGLDTLRHRLEAHVASGASSRQAAVRRMREFGERYRLSLGEAISRN